MSIIRYVNEIENVVVFFGNLGHVVKSAINNILFSYDVRIERRFSWPNGDLEMTFDEFKKDLIAFLGNSSVNLGRKGTKTRELFLETVKKKFDSYGDFDENSLEDCDDTQEPTTNPLNDRILCLKPSNKQRGLDAGKGVHAMTPTESARADEQLNRSPYTNKTKGKE